jgi:hypothetical protein
MRMDPAVSVPIPTMQEPAARAAPEPPLDPPGIRSVSHGLRVVWVRPPYANSWVWVLPTITIPASSSRCTATASVSGTCSLRTLELEVEGMPAVS